VATAKDLVAALDAGVKVMEVEGTPRRVSTVTLPPAPGTDTLQDHGLRLEY
jgi:hypothetical protein